MKNLIVLSFVFYLISCEGDRPMDIGMKGKSFRSCPEKSNSVSTQCENEDHKMNTITYTTNKSDVLEIITEVITNEDNSTLVKKDSSYTYAEFKTTVGWVDDVEFFIDDENKEIHYRSASRIGHSDFGTNRERMEDLTQKIKEKLRLKHSSSSIIENLKQTFGSVGIPNYQIVKVDVEPLYKDSDNMFKNSNSFVFEPKLSEYISMPTLKANQNYTMPILELDKTTDFK